MKITVLMVLMFLFSGCTFAEDYKEGVHYLKIDQQPTNSNDKVEVLEFFWYGCSHCYVFDPILSKWQDNKPSNVDFIRVPAVFRPEWKVHARTYYALQTMGVGEKFHTEIFEEIHKKKKPLDTLESMTYFLEGKGIEKDKFTGTYNSFSVDAMVRKAVKKMTAYKIDGVPTIAVNGKYVITGRNAGSYENFIKILEFLINKESASADESVTKSKLIAQSN